MLPTLRHLALCLAITSSLAAQAAGLQGGTAEAPPIARLGAPDPATAERLITIEAVASVRVPPSQLRLVFAVAAAGASSPEAGATCRARVTAARERLTAAGVAEGAVDTDFIAAVPIYAWGLATENKKEVLKEQRAGLRVQYNLHVVVADEAAALAAIEAATAADGVDLLAVDYWSDQLAAQQVAAQEQALAAAQAKAKRLLAVFPVAPLPINVHEETRVLYPQQLYQTLPRVEEAAGSWYSRDEMPRLPASRPLQTYYRGCFATVDAGSKVLPGKRELEVVSTVRLYYAAPERPPVAPPK
jgi:uncharacterized protein YggE